MNDKVAPSEADMAQRVQSSNQTNSTQNAANDSANSYVEALTRGMETTADSNQSQN